MADNMKLVTKEYVDSVESNLNTSISDVSDKVTQETSDRQTADTNLQKNIDKKLDKATVESNVTAAYAVQGTSQTTIPISVVPSIGSIACFNTHGNMSTNEPTEDTDATNKKYVDDLNDTLTTKYNELQQLTQQTASATVLNSSNINKEIDDRKEADTVLQNGITANETLINQEIDDRKKLEKVVDKKVDKLTYSQAVYVTSSDTPVSDTYLPWTEEAVQGSIPCRDSNSTFAVGEPTEDSHVSTKKYVDDTIASQVSSVYKAKGSVADLSSLPTPDKAHDGFVYNIENEFTTTDLFVEGAGKTYPAGTNVVIVNTTGTKYKYDVLAGMVDLSSYATKTELSGKVDKVSTRNVVYATGSSGTQTPTKYTSEPAPYTMMYRTTNGVVSVGTPTADTHATPKSYVDTADALKMNKSAFDYNDTTKTLTIDMF